LFGHFSNTWSRWLINNCLVKYDNFQFFVTKYVFDKSLTVDEIARFCKARVTPGDKGDPIDLNKYREYSIAPPKLLAYVDHNYDCSGVPESSLSATHKEIDNVKTFRRLPKKILLKVYPGCKRVVPSKEVRDNLKQYLCDMGSVRMIPEQYFGVLRGDSSDYDNPYSFVLVQLRYRKTLYTRYTLSARSKLNPAPVINAGK
jgi:hypothetical protein